jgi:hypothetical protein
MGTNYVLGTAVNAINLHRTVTGWHMAALDIYDNAASQLSRQVQSAQYRMHDFGGSAGRPFTSTYSNHIKPLIVSDATRVRLQQLFPPTDWDAIRSRLTPPVDFSRFTGPSFDVQGLRPLRDIQPMPRFDFHRYTAPTLPITTWDRFQNLPGSTWSRFQIDRINRTISPTFNHQFNRITNSSFQLNR